MLLYAQYDLCLVAFGQKGKGKTMDFINDLIDQIMALIQQLIDAITGLIEDLFGGAA